MYKITLILFTSILISCGSSSNETPPSHKLDLASGNYECVTLNTSMGDIILGLDKINAPEGVSNFLGYTNASFYNGTIFHRVIDGFMIQGGGFDENLARKATNAPIMNEADNGLLNTRSAVAWARTPDPQSATSQFFINTVDNGFLDFTDKTPGGWGYAVFGYVISGMNVVDSISQVDTGAGGPFIQDLPQENIVIQTAEVIACDGL